MLFVKFPLALPSPVNKLDTNKRMVKCILSTHKVPKTQE